MSEFIVSSSNTKSSSIMMLETTACFPKSHPYPYEGGLLEFAQLCACQDYFGRNLCFDSMAGNELVVKLEKVVFGLLFKADEVKVFSSGCQSLILRLPAANDSRGCVLASFGQQSIISTDQSGIFFVQRGFVECLLMKSGNRLLSIFSSSESNKSDKSDQKQTQQTSSSNDWPVNHFCIGRPRCRWPKQNTLH